MEIERTLALPPARTASWLNQRVMARDGEVAEGARSGWVIHVGKDRKLLVLWDDDEQTSFVSPDQLVESS